MRCLVFDLAPLAGGRHRAPPGAGAAANLGQPRHLAFIGLALVRAVGADRAGRWSRTVIESRNNQALLTTSAEFLLGQTPVSYTHLDVYKRQVDLLRHHSQIYHRGMQPLSGVFG